MEHRASSGRRMLSTSPLHPETVAQPIRFLIPRLIFAPIGQEHTGDDPDQHTHEQRHPQRCHEFGNEKPYGRPAPILEDEDHRHDDQDYPHYLSARERKSVPTNVRGHSWRLLRRPRLVPPGPSSQPGACPWSAPEERVASRRASSARPAVTGFRVFPETWPDGDGRNDQVELSPPQCRSSRHRRHGHRGRSCLSVGAGPSPFAARRCPLLHRHPINRCCEPLPGRRGSAL